MLLRFGHPEDKQAAAFNARSTQRARIIENVCTYYERYVPIGEWPTEAAPHCFYPKTFNRVPLGILQEAARRLQARKGGMV